MGIEDLSRVWREVSVAGYDVAEEALIYERPRGIVLHPSAAQRMVRFTQSETGVDVVVTPEHDMYATTTVETESTQQQFKKVTVVALFGFVFVLKFPLPPFLGQGWLSCSIFSCTNANCCFEWTVSECKLAVLPS